MKITSSWIEKESGLRAIAEYEDADDFSCVPYEDCYQVICFAFYKNQMLLVYHHKKGRWIPPGGGLEKLKLLKSVLEENYRKKRMLKC